jgi:uncharacterized protein (DUF2062 family)
MKSYFRKMRKYSIKGLLKNIKKYFFNSSETNIRLSFAVGIGIFTAIIPIWGFQNILALILSFLFKLNKVIVLTASNLSQPPFTPFIILGSYLLGGFLIGTNTESIDFSADTLYDVFSNDLLKYIIGSIVLAVIFSIVSGVITYYLLCFFRKNRINEMVQVNTFVCEVTPSMNKDEQVKKCMPSGY